MARPKSKNQDDLLTHSIMLRVTENDYQNYETLQKSSNCGSVPALVRRILLEKQIIVFYKETTMDAPMETLTGIQKELKSIGNNINQITQTYHNSKFETQQLFQLQKGLEQYQRIEGKVALLLNIISPMAKKWLQK
jgi:hypothetical protein